MNVLSLFDGMSCGMIALNRAGIQVNNYFASEIDKYAIQVSKKNYPEIIQCGTVTNIIIPKEGNEKAYMWSGDNVIKDKIDILIGGSPCQGFSFAGKQLAFEDPRSKLFFEYVRILKELKPKYFLLENVKMKKEFQNIISENLFGVQPIEINSALFSAQNRKRLYRVGKRNENGMYEQVRIEWPHDLGITIKDILEDNVDEKYNISEIQYEKLRKYESNARLSPVDGKSYCLNTMGGGHRQPKIAYAPGSREFEATGFRENKSPTITARDYKDPKIVQIPRGFNKGGLHEEKSPTLGSSSRQQNNFATDSYRIRKLTPIECERLQTVPDNYTEGVSNSQRYKMLGNGWTVDVIAHIFNHLDFTS